MAIARALAVEPSVLLLDEPLSALDAAVRSQIRDEIQHLQKTLEITTMFVTHDQAEALAIADRVVVLNGGVIEQCDAPEVVYQRPASEFVARFVGNVTELPLDGRRTFIRPEDLELVADPSGDYTVTGQSYTGERTIIRASGSADGAELISSAFLSQAKDLPTGTRVNWKITGEPAFVSEGRTA